MNETLLLLLALGIIVAAQLVRRKLSPLHNLIASTLSLVIILGLVWFFSSTVSKAPKIILTITAGINFVLACINYFKSKKA
ncbi:MAG: hypothetical protein KA319_06015 [Ferruginibacter sp.]|nr:hypothetical protein [Ferruginibacter sp.]